MSISLCCQFIEEKTSKKGKISFENCFEERVLQFGKFKDGKYPIETIYEIWNHNLDKNIEMLPKIIALGIKAFRLSSNIFPLAEELKDELENNLVIKEKLSNLGKIIKSNNIRVSCHPSQFVVLSSKNPDVIKNSIRNLAHHAWIFDSMNLDCTPYYSINIHGGVRGESENLISQVNNLSTNIKDRLTFENDEKCYSVTQLHEVYKKTNVPVVYDWHHHHFNDDNLSPEEASNLALTTWNGYKPNMHLSNTSPEYIDQGSFSEKRKHSFYTHYVPNRLKDLLQSNEVDCDWEFKGKNLAIFRAVEQFNLKL